MSKKLLLLFGCWVAFLSFGSAQAETRQRIEACLVNAAIHHSVSPRVLKAISIVESSMNPKAVNNANSNGTSDTGLMQINDWWLPTLAKHGIDRNDLFDGCKSAYVGAWILAHAYKQHGPTWRAVGSYNSPTPSKQQIYAQKVYDVLRKMP